MRFFNAIELVLAFSLLLVWTGTATAQPAPPGAGSGNSTKKTRITLLWFSNKERILFSTSRGAMQLSCGSPGRAFRNRRATLP